MTLSGASALCGCSALPFRNFLQRSDESLESHDIAEVQSPATTQIKTLTPDEMTDAFLKDVRARSDYFSQDFPDDIHFTGRKLELVKNLVVKFRAVQRHVGHGNFNVMGMDEFFHCAMSAAGAGAVNAEEKLFLEEIFFFDAKDYGFQGEKVVQNFTETINKSSILKVPYTGHFLRKGPPLETYNAIRKEVGDSIVLTSGVRALAKQYHLFFEKGLESNGNMSKASRSLAPPGYSFHGHGDFDVGRRGYGLKNFSDDFAQTEEYKALLGLGYIQIRYTKSNDLGVRFEPWHIKVHV